MANATRNYTGSDSKRLSNAPVDIKYSSEEESSSEETTLRGKLKQKMPETMFLSENVLVLPHSEVTGEAPSKPGKRSKPAYQQKKSIGESRISPAMHFKNGGDFAPRSEMVARRTNPCTLL